MGKKILSNQHLKNCKYSRRKIKFRIPFRRMNVARLKHGEINGMPFGNKTAVPFDQRYRFNLSRLPHSSLKEYKNRLSNKTF